MQCRRAEVAQPTLIFRLEFRGGGSHSFLETGRSLACWRSQGNTQVRSRLISQQSQQPGHCRRLARAWATGEHAYAAKRTDSRRQLLIVSFAGRQALVIKEPRQGSRQPGMVVLRRRGSKTPLQL